VGQRSPSAKFVGPGAWTGVRPRLLARGSPSSHPLRFFVLPCRKLTAVTGEIALRELKRQPGRSPRRCKQSPLFFDFIPGSQEDQSAIPSCHVSCHSSQPACCKPRSSNFALRCSAFEFRSSLPERQFRTNQYKNQSLTRSRVRRNQRCSTESTTYELPRALEKTMSCVF